MDTYISVHLYCDYTDAQTHTHLKPCVSTNKLIFTAGPRRRETAQRSVTVFPAATVDVAPSVSHIRANIAPGVPQSHCLSWSLFICCHGLTENTFLLGRQFKSPRD